MNTVLLMAIVLILIVVATVITKKVPFNFVLLIVPIVCALLLGYSVEETSTFVVEQLSSMMQSAGFMLLFAFLYFQMLTEAGVFDTIVTAVTTKLGNKMNVIVIMVLTTVIGGFSILTGNFTPAYLITFPILVPLYKKFDFDREAAFIIAQTAMSALCFIPWGLVWPTRLLLPVWTPMSWLRLPCHGAFASSRPSSCSGCTLDGSTKSVWAPSRLWQRWRR